MHVTIKTLSGKTIPVEIDPEHDNTDILFQTVEEKLGIPPAKQRLVLRGRVVAQDYAIKLLENVHEGVVFHLVLSIK